METPSVFYYHPADEPLPLHAHEFMYAVSVPYGTKPPIIPGVSAMKQFNVVPSDSPWIHMNNKQVLKIQDECGNTIVRFILVYEDKETDVWINEKYQGTWRGTKRTL